MPEKTNIPKVRFKGFTDAWEQRKLSSVCPITMGQSPDGSTYSDTESQYILVQGNADLKDGWVVPRVWTTQKTKTADAGDLIMSVRAPAGAMGKTAYNAVIGRGVAAIKGNEFVFQELSKMDSDGYWKKFSAGSTFESINSEILKKAVINIPNEEEQNKIGSCFSNLDSIITLHQRKCDKLQEMKKGLLQKMFPKNGSNTPEIRFTGYTDAWEQRKVGEIAKTYSGGTPLVSVKKYYSKSEIPFIRSGEISSNKTELFISNEGLNNSSAKLVKQGDILYALYGATSGEVSISLINGAINQAILAILPKSCIDNRFLMYWLRKSKSNITKTFLQGGQGNLSGEIIKSLEFRCGSLREQEMIGDALEKLDQLITLHQRKLELLKEMKKSLLQKMFC